MVACVLCSVTVMVVLFTGRASLLAQAVCAVSCMIEGSFINRRGLHHGQRHVPIVGPLLLCHANGAAWALSWQRRVPAAGHL